MESISSMDASDVVTKTGTVVKGSVALALGKVDISASDRAYRFQVVLAGFSSNQSDLKCGVRDDGKVTIEGVVTRGSVHNADVFLVKEFPPPGQFSISFNLPGPVDPRLTSLEYQNGILEATVMKFRIPYFPNNHH